MRKILQLGHVERATHLLGMPIINTQGDAVGRVNALTMDLPKGQVTHVIVKNNLQSDSRRVVLARALRFNDAGTLLVLDDSFVGLPNKPHFKWLNSGRTEFQQESYVNRKVLEDDGLDAKQNNTSPSQPLDSDEIRRKLPG
jgi:sporulation protein YlmC with PRC-barrel domain